MVTGSISAKKHVSSHNIGSCCYYSNIWEQVCISPECSLVLFCYTSPASILKCLSVGVSTCPQLYLDNRLIDLIENVHSDSVYMPADAHLIKCLTRSDIPDLQTFNRPNFIHIL